MTQKVGLVEMGEEIERIQQSQPHVAVAITGFAGAGKSTLTSSLVEVVPGSVRLRGARKADLRYDTT